MLPSLSPETQKRCQQAIAQLRAQSGLMAQLAHDDQGILALDWVEVVPRLLAQPAALETVEQEAKVIWQRGIKHVIWCGMGGSGTMVDVLLHCGFCRQAGGIMVHLLSSTDPAALNALLQELADKKHLPLSHEMPPDRARLRQLLEDMLLIGVSMSNTSEEPLTHASWFLSLLEQAHLVPADHLLVMICAESSLEHFAQKYDIPAVPLILEDDHTGFIGRMSAPGTRVFLLPVALHFAHCHQERGQLAAILQQAWRWHDLEGTERDPASHPFVRVATTLFQAQDQGICRLFLSLPEGYSPLFVWIEQLLEQSLGKQGKGIIVFEEQRIRQKGVASQAFPDIHVRATSVVSSEEKSTAYQLVQPYLTSHPDPVLALAAIVASCLGWQLTTALYAYLCGVSFATEPAVERYKHLARLLQGLLDPFSEIDQNNSSVLLLSRLRQDSATRVAKALVQASQGDRLVYLDVTWNGEVSDELWRTISSHVRTIGNRQLATATKVRLAPACYHISEQAQLDGPPLVSLRLLQRDYPACLAGIYRAGFLQAQAAVTWLAMQEQSRPCFLLLVDDAAPGGASEALDRFFVELETRLKEMYHAV